MEPSLRGEGWCWGSEEGVDGGNLSRSVAGIQQSIQSAPAWCSKCLGAEPSLLQFETAF